MSTDVKFEGWVGLGPESAQGKMEWQGFDPKPFEETDVDIEVPDATISAESFVLTIYRSAIAVSVEQISIH